MRWCHLLLLQSLSSLTANSRSVLTDRGDADGRRLPPNTTAATESYAYETQPSGQCMSNLNYPCAPLGEECTRPSLVHVIRLRGCGNKMLIENVLEHVMPHRSSVIVNEGWSLAHPAVQHNLATVRAAGKDGLIVLMLRDPIDRAISRYWFEGRWQLFHERTPGSAMKFDTWLRRRHCRPKSQPSPNYWDCSRSAIGCGKAPRLWDCTEDYYVKTFANWTGTAQCDESAEGCVDGLDERSLETAKKTLLDLGFDRDGDHGGGGRLLLLVTEMLNEPALMALAGRMLCFRHEGGVTPAFRPFDKPTDGRLRHVPSFKPKHPGGGHSSARPWDWQPSADEMLKLRSANKWDRILYDWATAKIRRRLEREFPDLPLAGAP